MRSRQTPIAASTCSGVSSASESTGSRRVDDHLVGAERGLGGEQVGLAAAARERVLAGGSASPGDSAG